MWISHAWLIPDPFNKVTIGWILTQWTGFRGLLTYISAIVACQDFPHLHLKTAYLYFLTFVILSFYFLLWYFFKIQNNIAHKLIKMQRSLSFMKKDTDFSSQSLTLGTVEDGIERRMVIIVWDCLPNIDEWHTEGDMAALNTVIYGDVRDGSGVRLELMRTRSPRTAWLKCEHLAGSGTV